MNRLQQEGKNCIMIEMGVTSKAKGTNRTIPLRTQHMVKRKELININIKN